MHVKYFCQSIYWSKVWFKVPWCSQGLWIQIFTFNPGPYLCHTENYLLSVICWTERGGINMVRLFRCQSRCVWEALLSSFKFQGVLFKKSKALCFSSQIIKNFRKKIKRIEFYLHQNGWNCWTSVEWSKLNSNKTNTTCSGIYVGVKTNKIKAKPRSPTAMEGRQVLVSWA